MSAIGNITVSITSTTASNLTATTSHQNMDEIKIKDVKEHLLAKDIAEAEQVAKAGFDVVWLRTSADPITLLKDTATIANTLANTLNSSIPNFIFEYVGGRAGNTLGYYPWKQNFSVETATQAGIEQCLLVRFTITPKTNAAAKK